MITVVSKYIKMFKQVTVDDNPTGIRWITSDLIGLSYKMRNLKAETDTT